MKMRLERAKVSPAAYHAMVGLESFVHESSKLEVSLLDPVKTGASQINGCAFSIDMHSQTPSGLRHTLHPAHGLP